jgi:hypothetical protein
MDSKEGEANEFFDQPSGTKKKWLFMRSIVHPSIGHHLPQEPSVPIILKTSNNWQF